MKFISVIILFFSILNAFGGKTDSIHSLLSAAQEDSVKIRLYLELGDAWEMASPDSQNVWYVKAEREAQTRLNDDPRYRILYADALNYQGIYYSGQGDFDRSMHLFARSLKESRELLDEEDTVILKEGRRGIGTVLMNMANIRYFRGDYSGAINDYMAAMYIKKLLNDPSGIALCVNNIGLIYMAQGRDDRAIAQFQEALGIWSGLISVSDDKAAGEIQRRMSMALMNLGILQRNQKNYEVAIDYYQQALEIRQKLNDLKGMSECYLNMGVAYKHLKETDKAFLYYDKALYVFEKMGDKKAIMRGNNNIGLLFTEAGEWTNAQQYLSTAMTFALESGDRQSLAHIHNNLADLYNRQLQYANALKMGRRALEISDSIGSMPEKIRAFSRLMESYAGSGSYKEAYQYAKNYITASDSLQGTEKMKYIQEMESRYQAEKKQQEIEKQKLTIRRNEEEIKRRDAEAALQRIFLISALVVLVLTLILVIFIWRSYRIKKRAHRDISLKNNQLEQANTEISAQRDEIEAQRDALSNQKKHIEKILDEQVNSIRYAQRIQKALIPARDILDEIIIENNPSVGGFAVFFRPKDIVSGDFYWAARVEDRLIFCVADCTGHGVPGAFMSLLGVSYLNEIVKRSDVLNASDILNELRASIVVSLRQQKSEDGSVIKQFNPAIPINRDALHEVKDGMDIALCVLNTQTRELQFSGANNPLYLLRKKSTEGLEVIAGDKMPIGVYLRMEPFSMKTMVLEPGDIVHLMSDGFTDQFGGDDYKKFGNKRLRALLEKNQYEPVETQKQIFERTFADWKGSYQQLDDVCVLSLQIK